MKSVRGEECESTSRTSLKVVLEIGVAYPLIGDHAGAYRRLGGTGHPKGRAVRGQPATGDNCVALAHTRLLTVLEPDIETLGCIKQCQFVTDDETTALDCAKTPPVRIHREEHL